uniref:Uncharacterized protein MANES_02G005100 n=1 Tax=Rhizophora mucronata TaxID=61149 RepID=A0A2P2ITT8_RHIMU
MECLAQSPIILNQMWVQGCKELKFILPKSGSRNCLPFIADRKFLHIRGQF